MKRLVPKCWWFVVVVTILFVNVYSSSEVSSAQTETIENEAIENEAERDPVELDQAKAQDLNIKFGWQVGDVRKYSVSTSKRSAANKLTRSQKDVLIKVVEESDDGVIVEFQILSKVDLETVKPLESIKGGTKLVDLANDLVIEVNVNRNGYVQEVLNWDEVQQVVDHTEKTIRGIVDDMKISERGKQFFDKFMKQQSQRSVVEATMLEPLNHLLMMTGISVSVDQPDVSETTTSMMMTNDVPATETYEVVSHDPQSKIANVRWERTVDGKTAGKIIEKGFQAYLRKMGAAESELKPLNVDGRLAQSTSNVWIDTESGWVTRIVWNTEAKNVTNGKDGAKLETVIVEIPVEQGTSDQN